ncbi:hypothetical protein [Lacihabitans soyangensis]|uniref:Uncharacterized protein n=1 Tax=Lacihabitans soyangensis TaxID=869394 RepID=A0AAE3KT89_9BACT|nr:hypothetical protein [Lacihabitans soyangensis]MCP9764122.1 hypothetical protein [Lacihabitans soyangensis]
MEEPKPKSIRTIGLIVSIFSGFIIFSNGMGALAFSIIDFGDELSGQNEFLDFNPIGFLFANYIYMCLIMVTIGVLYLIGGLSVQKYKLWANKLVTYISAILLILIWTFMVVMLRMTAEHESMKLFNIGIIISAVFWSTPIGLLIWFLNQGNIKKHFV